MDTLIKFENLAKVLTDYAIEVRNKYQDSLIMNDRIASGDLLNSIEYTTHFDGNDYWVGLQLEDYWKYVENDTEPHMPPVSAILKWVQVKPVLPKPNSKLKTPLQIAWAKAKAIEKFGTKGSHDLSITNKELSEEYEERIKEAIDKDLGESCHSVIKTLYVDGYERVGRNRTITL